MHDAPSTPVQRILDAIPGEKKRSGRGWICLCPAHDDHNPSLSVTERNDGAAKLKCFKGCPDTEILAAIGMEVKELLHTGESFAPRSKPKQRRANASNLGPIVKSYDWTDEGGGLLYQNCRHEPPGYDKTFRQRRPGSKPDTWIWNLKDVRRVPYRLHRLVGDRDGDVLWCEGEKDVHTVEDHGFLGSTSGSASSWKPEIAPYLKGRVVHIVCDEDPPGIAYAETVAKSLYGFAKAVKIVRLPGLEFREEHGDDVSDWFAKGHTREDLLDLISSTPEWQPSEADPPQPESWPEIESLEVPNLPEFPAHVLPPALRSWVMAESRATQTPLDLPGLVSLAACSSLIARKVEVSPRDGWREPTNIFTVVLLPPGNRKSPVFSDALKPLRELEAELIEAARPTVVREQSERRQLEARLKKLERVAAEKDDEHARHEAGNVAEQLANMPEAVLPRLLVDDATSEKLGMLLAEQGGRIASMSPEGGVFDLMAGLYSRNSTPQFTVHLLAHAADDILTDRVSRQSVRVERPALTCAYTVQPQVILGLAKNPAFRGRGLLGRFLFSSPKSRIGSREVAPNPVPESVSLGYRHVVRQLGRIEGEHVLHLSMDAARAFLEWETEIEAMLAEGGPMEGIRDWGGKLAGATLRIAAVLHCAERGAAGDIQAGTVNAAVEIARYLIPHAEAVLETMEAREDTKDDDARYVLRWIKRQEISRFTRRMAHQGGRRRFHVVDDIDPALRELTARGYIRKVSQQAAGPGRPPSPEYEVNPAVIENETARNCTHNTQNSRGNGHASNSEDCEYMSKQFQNSNRVRVVI